MPDIASSTDPVATTLAIVALLIALGVLALLVLVLVGIHAEERHMSLTSAPPHPHRGDNPPPDRSRRPHA